MKKIFLICIGLVATVTFANASGAKNCGVVTIKKVLTGPRHGAMMQVSDSTCGAGGWVCLDPNNEILSKAESEKLFSFVLAHKISNQQVQLSVYNNVYARACAGNYPVVEDIRTP